MKVELFDFQVEALGKLRGKLKQARSASSPKNPQAIAFSAPTGAGKTIVITALFEQILFGESDLEAQPDAAILWISDMPELNEQTRLKIEAMSDRIRTHQLITIDSDFDAEQLVGGNVYFVNTQKLGTDKLLTRRGDDRQFSIWETFTNTAQNIPEKFYVVIDEAHRGMTRGQRAQRAETIMQRFILGSTEHGLCCMPMILGISATPKRFEQLLSGTDNTVHKVLVSHDDVRASGLLKDRILIHFPESEGQLEMALLAQAAREWQNLENSWQTYCNSQGEAHVYPILVAQVEDSSGTGSTRTDLSAAISTIEDAISRPLREGEAAHTLHDHGDLNINGHNVRRVEASRIQENKEIGIVFFKMSLSTGWDCPRAEVMMSFRRAEDHTYIAQLLGRMVRSPLARRIEAQSDLNDVHLYLPYYDRKAVNNVITDLQNHEEVPPTEAGTHLELRTLKRRPNSDAIFAASEGLVTYHVDKVRTQSDLRRYVTLGRRLSHDGIAEDALQKTLSAVVKWLDEEIEHLRTIGELERQAEHLTGVKLKTVAFTHSSATGDEQAIWTVESVQADIDRQFERAGRILGEGLHQTWWKAHPNSDPTRAKIELIVVVSNHKAIDSIHSKSATAFNELYAEYKQEFGRLPEKLRAKYERLRAAAREPEPLDWRLPNTLDFKRSSNAERYTRHLFVEEDGHFRADLGNWESGIIKEELANDEVVAWLRNVDRKHWALQIPYEVAGQVKPMYPDFVVVRHIGKDYLFDILEPHDPSRSDNHWKAVGLAKFADKHWNHFSRIQLIRKETGRHGKPYFSRLDVGDETTRAAVRSVQTNEQLDKLFSELSVST